MKKTVLVMASFLAVQLVQAQEVVSTQGDSYSNANGSIDFTIGEPVINTATDGTNDLTQGFHQTMWNFVGLEDLQSDLLVDVYPNPVESELMINTEEFQGLTYQLFDGSGRVVREGELKDATTSIDVNGLTQGAYQLRLTDANQQALKTFKLIKNH